VVEVNEVQFGRVGDEASVEDRLQDLLPRGKGREVAVAFQEGSQGEAWEVAGQDAVDQTVNDILVRTQIVLVFMVVSLVPLVTTTARATVGRT
jgi:hypothetical protein